MASKGSILAAIIAIGVLLIPDSQSASARGGGGGVLRPGGRRVRPVRPAGVGHRVRLHAARGRAA